MKILIAEDDRDLNEIIVKKLRSEGYEADSCMNGQEAADRLLFAEYDLAIMDIMMPVMDGIEALKMIREQNNRTPVILLTAKDSVDDKVQGLNAGANDYMVKPFSFEELYARIRALQRTITGISSNLYRLCDLTLDTESHIVKRGGKEINVTGKEYRLLEYLMTNQGRILSRTKIVNYVWGYDYEGGTKVVDVYMNYLRKKIDEGFEPKLLHTVRGIGYVMRSHHEQSS